jgi:hypothetical protein
VRCPECAAEVSPLREFCPSCGTPTDPAVRQHLKSSRDPNRPAGRGDRPPEELKRNRKTLLIAGGVLLVAMAAFGRIGPFHGFQGPRDIHIDTHFNPVRVDNEAITIGAPELFEAYHTDSDAANRRFGGRQMVVTGQFVRTVPDGYGSIDMRLKTNHPDLPLGIDLDSHSVDEATKLEPGQMVTVSCQKVAGTGDDPWLQDCVIQPPALPGANAGASAGAGSSGPPSPPGPPPPPGG